MKRTKFSVIYILFIISLCVISSSCSKETQQEKQPLEWQYGKNVYNQTMDDTLRNFIIHVPTGYVEGQPVPVVFMLHGSSGSGNKFYNISGWVQKGEQENIITVFPTALQYPIVEKNNRLSTKWSSKGLIPQIPQGYPIKDDVPFFEEMIDLIKATFSIDASRIYVSGFSNGGAFVKSRLMEEMDDTFAAMSGGGFGIRETIIPSTMRYTPFLSILGSKEEQVLEDLGLQSIPSSMTDILAIPVFNDNLNSLLDALNLGNAYKEISHGDKYKEFTWDDDLSGQGNEYKFILVNKLEHKYPNGKNNPQNVVAVDILWPWFSKFSLNP